MPERSQSPSFFSYMLRCADGSFYCGWTVNPQERLAAHNRGKAARYTRTRLPVCLVYLEEYACQSEAMRREHELKKLDHSQKSILAERAIKNGMG